jgi:membrane carboxypeptidase/penicillin-binding protein PbpC
VADGLYLRGRSSDRTCSVHVEAQIDEKAGVRLCPLCARGREYTVRVVESWPADLAAWLRQHGRGDNLAPPHFGGCARRDEGEAPPLILSPAAGQCYVLQENAGAARQRLLLKAASRAGKVYWFIDGALQAAGAPLEPAFWPLERGPHTILCSDGAGRCASVAIEVR